MFRFNIRQKFVSYLILISFIPLLIVGATADRTSSTVLQDVASLYTLELINHQRNYIDLQLEQIENLISNISGITEIRTILEDTSEPDTFTDLTTGARIGYILNGYLGLEGLASIDIFTVTGRHFHVGDTLNVDNIREDVRDRLFSETIISDDLFYWAGIEDNVNPSSRHEKVLTVSRILYQVNRETLEQEAIAMILVNYSIEHLYEYLITVNFGDDAYMVVVDGQDRIVYHPDTALLGETIGSNISELMTSPDGSSFRDISGTEMSISIASSRLGDWKMISFIPVNTLLSRTNDIRFAMILVLVGCFIAITIISGIFNQNTVVPIRQITAKYQEIEKDLTVEPVVIQGNDEISELSRWFNNFLITQKVQRQTEKALRKSLVNTELLYQTSRDLMAIKNIKEILRSVADNLSTIDSVYFVMLTMLDTTKKEIVDLFISGERAEFVTHPDYAYFTQGLPAWVLKHREPTLSLKNIPDARESIELQTIRTQMGIGSVVIVPLIYQDRIFGVVNVARKLEAPNFVEDDVNLILTLSNQAIVAIQNAHLVQSLRESENKFYTAFHASPDPMTIISLADQYFIDANNSFLKLFGYKREDVIRKSPADLNFWLNPDNQQEFLELLENGSDLRNFEAQFKSNSTEMLINTLLSAEIIDLNGETAYLMAIKDMTEQRKLEQQRLEFKVERERVQVLSSFITEASHEFRTPLSIINTNAYILSKTSLDDNNVRLIAIKQQVEVISNLVDSLNLMAKIDNDYDTRIGNTSINDVLRSIYYAMEKDLRAKNLECIVELSDVPLYVLGNVAYLEQAFENIWRNAIQYTEDGTITVSSKLNNGQALIEVVDTGIGISTDDLPHIFKRFYQSDKSGNLRGFGLGLSITNAIISRYGGDILVETQQGEGTRVRVTLPLAK